MSYPLRIEVPYGYYHVATRGNNRRKIFDDSRDRELFLQLLARVSRRYGWHVHAFCLMGNHYHLVLQISESGLAPGMCRLNTAYALTYNTRHQRTNHLFGRRYWSELIETDEYLVTACRYVLQNPIRAGLSTSCEGWKWSSYRATIGLAPAPAYLAVSELLEIAAPGPATRRVDRFRSLCSMSVPNGEGRSGQIRWQPP